jgi:hypothetical protein
MNEKEEFGKNGKKKENYFLPFKPTTTTCDLLLVVAFFFIFLISIRKN